MPAGDWPAPHLAAEAPPGGPVMVTVEYRPREGLHDDLLAALEDARYSRRRSGASAWRVWQDSGQPEPRSSNEFVVASWQDRSLTASHAATRSGSTGSVRRQTRTTPPRSPTGSHRNTTPPRRRENRDALACTAYCYSQR